MEKDQLTPLEMGMYSKKDSAGDLLQSLDKTGQLELKDETCSPNKGHDLHVKNLPYLLPSYWFPEFILSLWFLVFITIKMDEII